MRSDICRFLTKSLGFSTVSCYALLLLQGFQLWGFKIDEMLLKGLIAATITQSGVLLTVFVNAVWHRTNKNPHKISPDSP